MDTSRPVLSSAQSGKRLIWTRVPILCSPNRRFDRLQLGQCCDRTLLRRRRGHSVQCRVATHGVCLGALHALDTISMASICRCISPQRYCLDSVDLQTGYADEHAYHIFNCGYLGTMWSIADSRVGHAGGCPLEELAVGHGCLGRRVCGHHQSGVPVGCNTAHRNSSTYVDPV